MPITAARAKKLINNLNLDTAQEALGDYIVTQATRKAASVALAAGANPTKAEFDALVNSLKNASLMA